MKAKVFLMCDVFCTGPYFKQVAGLIFLRSLGPDDWYSEQSPSATNSSSAKYEQLRGAVMSWLQHRTKPFFGGSPQASVR